MAMRLVMGNEAVALGAIAAGCDFYAGYPITPATEIMEEMSRLLPPRGGVFLQMEDELGAMAAVIGAAWGGARAMTATSGPGFSLMQENLGYAAMTRTPCVVVDSQRGGPSTGLPTLPAQADVMQSRFGSHGDRPAVVLTASSVRGAYDATVRSFALAQRHRLPVVLLLDAVVSHMREPVDLPAPPPPGRREAQGVKGQGAPFAPFGEGPPVVVTGLAHGADGLPHAHSGKETEQMLRAAQAQLLADPQLRDGVQDYRLDDADVAVVAYGITARAAREAVDLLREDGVRAGLVDLNVIWPFPTAQVQTLARRVHSVVVVELNLGQMVMPVEAAVAGQASVWSLGRADGELMAPKEIAQAVIRFANGPQKGGLSHAQAGV